MVRWRIVSRGCWFVRHVLVEQRENRVVEPTSLDSKVHELIQVLGLPSGISKGSEHVVQGDSSSKKFAKRAEATHHAELCVHFGLMRFATGSLFLQIKVMCFDDAIRKVKGVETMMAEENKIEIFARQLVKLRLLRQDRPYRRRWSSR